MRFEGRVAVVTGASRGIGRTTALALAKEGCNVVIGYEKNREKAHEVVQAAKESGVRAIAVACDVSIRNDVETMFKNTVQEFGKVDILVNNAGIDYGTKLLETTDEVWDRTLDVNLKGVFLCTQVAARYMIQRRYGKVVNIASNSGFGIAVWGETAYAASKAGIIQMTKTAAFELGEYGINVNCVAPGAVNTEMLKGNMTDQEYAQFLDARKKITSLGSIAEPDDVANVVLFFASDESRFVTGKTLLVDGGRRDFL
ncbi:MAG: 3-oxoacyl-ACP reductase family protein [Candidatus Bathyarchaeia archaeon]